MAATTRTTTYTHADGTVSKRNSKTRVYEWAVESKRDLHAEAGSVEHTLDEHLRKWTSFDRAVESGKRVRSSRPWSQGDTYVTYSQVDPETGEKHYLGAEVHNSEGDVTGEAVDADAAIQRIRTDLAIRREQLHQEILRLTSGPRFEYGIIRWSEREASAIKACDSFDMRHTTFRVVRAETA